MATYSANQERVIPRSISFRASYLIFVACAFPIHLWSIIQMLQELPAWLMRLEVSDLLGVIAYTQVFALLETLLIWGMIMLLTFILPWRLSGERFIPLISSLIFIHAVWAGTLHSAFGVFRAMGSLQLLLVLAFYLLSVTGVVLLVLRSGRFNVILQSLLERLAVLITLYITFDILGILVILMRNL